MYFKIIIIIVIKSGQCAYVTKDGNGKGSVTVLSNAWVIKMDYSRSLLNMCSSSSSSSRCSEV